MSSGSGRIPELHHPKSGLLLPLSQQSLSFRPLRLIGRPNARLIGPFYCFCRRKKLHPGEPGHSGRDTSGPTRLRDTGRRSLEESYSCVDRVNEVGSPARRTRKTFVGMVSMMGSRRNIGSKPGMQFVATNDFQSTVTRIDITVIDTDVDVVKPP